MLTSPSPLGNNNNNNVVVGRYGNARCVPDVKGNFSENPPGTNENLNNNNKSNVNNNSGSRSSSMVDCQENGENHGGLMYKFKNNIKQRFSKENEEIMGERRDEQMVSPKKQKIEKCSLVVRERLSLGGEEEKEKEDRKNREEKEVDDDREEKIFKYKTDLNGNKRLIDSESIIYDKESINKININRRESENKYRNYHNYHNGQKLWGLSPPPPLPPPHHHHPLPPLLPPSQNVSMCSPTSYGPPHHHSPILCKSIAIGSSRQEFSSGNTNNNNNNYSTRCLETGYGIPIFALHSKGSFYVPLTLDHATLAPFLNVLGVTKKDNNDDEVHEKTVLHPVTISVNFQSHLMR